MKRSMIFLLLTLTLCTGSALAQDFSTSNDKIYTAVEQMPQFPGGDSKLMKYISENIKYPETDECVDGQVIVQFVVTKTGEVGDVKIVRHLHPMFDEEAVRVVKSLPKFIPGRMNGVPVNVWYTLPVRFHMKHIIQTNPVPNEKVYEVTMPQFPKGEETLMKLIADNFQPPFEYHGEKCNVTVKIEVTKTGEIGEVRIIESDSDYVNESVVKSVKTLPRFTPGTIDGETVNMWYTLPQIKLVFE